MVLNPSEERGRTAGGQAHASREPDWVGLVDRIQRDQPDAMEELYAIFGGGVRFYICRQLGREELDDRVHDLFLVIVQAIRRSELRDPRRLMGFVRTVMRRHVAGYIEKNVQTRDRTSPESGEGVLDGRSNPEEDAIKRQQTDIMEKILRSASVRDREVLTRFYFLGHAPDKICADMGLTENQFRLLKSRAKSRFIESAKRALERKNRQNSMRAQAASGH